MVPREEAVHRLGNAMRGLRSTTARPARVGHVVVHQPESPARLEELRQALPGVRVTT
ncbi:hypothetical protein [Lentzea jiangxiensis]|uniref:Uncharacterized protein n=1 Tax=Lentzea jiangxiensis TaxID=641025 RepID=A0A1H0GTQ6_9PSEU|nr:hypothetical protein [Lentzea jiangxiensis]SDO10239.1 hypothetical protein SAMN05421507_1011351 [Lentzea jiangxiensis]